MNQGSGFRNHELARRARAAAGNVLHPLLRWWGTRAAVVDVRQRIALVAEELVGDRFERLDRYCVASEDSIGNNLTFGQAKEIGRQIAAEGKPVLFGEVLADGSLHVIQFFPGKDPTMSSKPKAQHFPIHPNYDRSQPPIGYLVLDDEEAAKHDLGTLVIAPGGVADDDGHIEEVVEFGVFPAERLRRREGQARVPLMGNTTGPELTPVGYVELDEHLTEPGIRNFVAVPVVESENGAPSKAVSFKLEHREVVGGGDPIPVITGPMASDMSMPVGSVRLSESMTFQYGPFKDLELVPVVEGVNEDIKVVAYQVVNKNHRIATVFQNLKPGPHIFRVDETGRVFGLEAIPDRHIVEFGPEKYSMAHPYECRAGGKSLHDCEMWERVSEMKEELEDRGIQGRFFVTLDEESDQLIFADVDEDPQGPPPEGDRATA